MLRPSASEIRPHFLTGAHGPLFCIDFPAARGSGKGDALLVVAPIGEEMNKCRRMLALTARACQAAGISVSIVDPIGTGDSGGDFRDATVARWRDDLGTALEHVAASARRVHVLGVRSGALLFDPAVIERERRGRLVLWQPVITGRHVVPQWLRLATASELVAGAESGSEQRTRGRLREAGFIEIAGYDLSATLIAELEPLELKTVLRDWQSAVWFELVADAGAGMSPAASRGIAAAAALGLDIDGRAVVGEPFWATPEIAVVPALADATRDFLAAA
jgi:exosortase A-associated hydrolase 2